MPWSADIDPFYWDFGNGYVPFFLVVGAYNIVMYGDNGVAGAINTVPDAIASFDEMGVVNPIGDQTMYFGDSYNFDVSDLFGHPYGEPVDVYVYEISDPNIIDAVIVDNILTLTAFNTKGTANVNLYGIGGTLIWFYDFNVTVFDPNSVTEENTTPLKYDLLANYPNPFNPSTLIGYSLKNQDHVSLVIFNSKGQQISTLFNAVQDACLYNVVWNGRDDYSQTVSSGIYFYKLKAGRFTSTKKMILMK